MWHRGRGRLDTGGRRGENNTNQTMAQRGGGDRAQNTGQEDDKTVYKFPKPDKTNVNVNKADRKPLSRQRLFEDVANTGNITEQSKVPETEWIDNHGLSQATGTTEDCEDKIGDNGIQNEVIGTNMGNFVSSIISSPVDIWRFATGGRRTRSSGNEMKGKGMSQG